MASDTLVDDGSGTGGTFWSTFHNTPGGEPALSPLEQLLQSPDCSVKALLEDDDIIQEFKSGNERLLARLCTVDACMALIEFITQDPSEEDRLGLNLDDHAPTECTAQAPHVRCLRYPFISVEIMTCGSPQLLQFFVSPNTGEDDLLCKLWNFVEVGDPQDINPVLAGYFQRAVAAILSRHSLEMVTYLRTRGADALLERFLERLHLRSLAELFARLLCVENSAQLLFPVDGLVLRLLKRLEDPGVSDIQENISLIVQELLAHKESLCYSEELMAQLTEPAAVRLLVDHIFGGRAACTSASIAILNSVLHNSYMATVAATPGTNNGALSPVSPPLLTLNDDDIVNFGADELDTEASSEVVPPRQTSPDRTSPPMSPANSHSGAPTANCAEARSTALIREVSSHLPRIKALICANLEQTKNVGLPVGTVPSVGITILEVLSLLTTLVRTGSTDICEVLLNEQLLPRCFEVFFRHPWSSLLHNAVRNLLSEILCGLDGTRTALMLFLLREGALLDRVTAEYAEEERYRAGGRKKHPRVGYMGILHNMCLDIRDYGRRIPEIGALLASVSGWNDTVLPAVNATSRIHGADLGGGVPSEDRNLASSSATMGSMSSQGTSDAKSAEDDFVLDDIQDDLDEEGGGFKSGREPSSFDEVLVDSGGRENGNAAYLESDFNPDSIGDSNPAQTSTDTPADEWVASFDFPPSGESQPMPDSQAQSEKSDASPAATASDFGAFESQPTSEQAANPQADNWTASFTEKQPQTEDLLADFKNTAVEANSEEWAAFDSAFAPSSAPPAEDSSASAQPDNTVTKEDLFNLLAPSSVEKRVEAPAPPQPAPQWPADFPSWGAPPQSSTPTAVPSSCAPMTGVAAPPTKAPAEDLTWTAKFSSGPEATLGKPTPVPTSAASLSVMGDANDPWALANTSEPSSTAGQVGTENLFALLEQDAGASAFSGTPAAPPIASITPEALSNSFNAAPMTGLPDVASPWPLDGMSSMSSAPPASATPAVSAEDPFATLMSPKSAVTVPNQSQAPLGSSPMSASNADRSWVADFDPLLQNDGDENRIGGV